MKNVMALMAALTFLVACSTENPPLIAPPETYQTVKGKFGGFSAEFEPKASILFIVDNSGSMKDEQDLVEQNMNLFAKELATDSVIDFRVGVTSVYDTTDMEERKFKFKPDFANGELWPLVNPVTGQALEGPRFVTRKTQFAEYESLQSKEAAYVEIMKKSINIGVKEHTDGGPQYEESLSPLLAALSPDMLKSSNNGFYDPDSHLVIIIMTDAEDSSPGLDAETVGRFLFDLKPDGDFFVYLMIPPMNQPGCRGGIEKEPPQKLHALAEFLGPRNSEVIDLCHKEYAGYLTKIGQDTRKRVNSRIIPLESWPNVSKEKWDMVVRYGQQVIPPGPEGWTYIPEGPAIKINPDIKLTQEENAQITVEYVAVKPNNITNGRTKPINQ